MGASVDRYQRWWNHHAVWLICAAVWLVSLPRMIPILAGGVDHGTFVSVAERLLAGDRLYADVYDNKDPLFFYLLAGARAVSDYGDLALELAWMAAACVAIAIICRQMGLPPYLRALVGWAATPIVLAGAAYAPGMTSLPATALCLWLVAAALAHRWATAGVMLALVAFVKLVVLPVGLAILLVAAFRTRSIPFALARSAAGMIPVAAATTLVLAIRGELRPYLAAQVANVSYAQGEGLIESHWPGPVAHLLRLAPESGSGGVLVTVLTLLAILVFAGPSPRGGDRLSAERVTLWLVTLLVSATCVVVLAATGLWIQHGQLFYLPGILAVVLVASSLQAAAWGRWRGTTLILVVACLVGGTPHPQSYANAARSVRENAASVTGASEAAVLLAGEAAPGSYARLGAMDFEGHARGMDDWRLACPRFHQYYFQTAEMFSEVVSCFPTADVVIVSDTFVPMIDAPGWNSFVLRSRQILAEQFHCTVISTGEVCLHK